MTVRPISPFLLVALSWLTQLGACQSAPVASAEVASHTVSGPCATLSQNPQLLPDDPSPEFMRASFDGLWYLSGDESRAHQFGLLSPNRMYYRATGLHGFGGIVPLKVDAIAPWTFRHSGGDVVVFITTDCAELRAAQGLQVTDQVVGVFEKRERPGR
ncbi:MAG: hypothetical protein AAF996_03690 [Pseudomonadota bacterium]